MNRFFNESSDKAPRTIVRIDNTWYMVTRPNSWENFPHGFNAGDCCWWTALAALTYPKDKGFISALLNLSPFMEGKKWLRHPFSDITNTPNAEDEFSRDHLIMAVTALTTLLSGDKDDDINTVIDKTKFRLSKKFYLRLDLYFWLRSLRHRGTFKGWLFGKLFTTIAAFKLQLKLIWLKIVESILGRKAKRVHPNDIELCGFVNDTSNLIHKYLRLKFYPIHLAAWQLWALNQFNIKSPIASLMIRLLGGPHNYLLTALSGAYVNRDIIKAYESRTGWLWQSHGDCTITLEKCNTTEAKYNAMDKDILLLLCDVMEK